MNKCAFGQNIGLISLVAKSIDSPKARSVIGSLNRPVKKPVKKPVIRQEDRRVIRSTFSSTIRLSAVAAGLMATSLINAPAVLAQAEEKETEYQDLPITVQSGDTFSSIISRELKSLDAWGEIANYNKLSSPDRIKPGDVIVIPAELLRLRNYATVVFVKRTALHHDKSGDSLDELKKGDRLYTGDLVETDKDGFVSVSFNGGSSVNIQPESMMRINVLECVDQEEACEVSLESSKGQLGLDVRSVGFKKPTVFNINTPYASAAVRGTRFDFEINDGNILGVTEGTVEISVNGSSNEIDVGKGVLAGEGRSIDEVFDLLPEPALKLVDDVNRISSEDIINWQPTTDAANYRIAFASNESMQDVITSFSESGTLIKPELQVGDVFISARAIASNGLRGFVSKNKLTSVSIDEDTEGPLLEVSVADDNMMQITAPGPAGNEYEVKIGNALTTIESRDYIVTETVLQMTGGETQTLEIDRTLDWYLQSREVLGQEEVSPYGLLYHFEKTEG